MVKSITIPWGAWSGEDETHILEFPDSWDVQVFDMRDADDITNPKAIESVLNNPVGTPTIRDLAKGKNTAVIVVEDISRPTKCGPICEQVLKELNGAGIPDENVTLIGAIGAHRPMNREDYIKKVGSEMVERINIENHHPYENLQELGESELGTPIHVNKTYYEADVKIAVGTVIPHPLAGFGGGAKIILPGLCGIETLEANHEAALGGKGVGLGFITERRKDIEDVCKRVGLDFSINIIATKNRGIAGIFAGHFVEAHRKAIELAREVYRLEIPDLEEEDKLDIGLFNLFPEDTDLCQASKGTNLFMKADKILKEEAAIIFMTSSYEGRGFHGLLGETGGRLYDDWIEAVEVLLEFCEEKAFAIYSPNLSRADVTHYWTENMDFYSNFSDIIKFVEEEVEGPPKAGVFTTSIQLTPS
jgi:nickel-dependent lactate racemase